MRSGLISGISSAVTSTVSYTASSSSSKTSSRISPRATVTSSNLSGLKPAIVDVTVYGPPTRTFRMLNRPFSCVVAAYRVPVGTWIASMSVPGSRLPSVFITTCPVRPPVVS